MQVLNKNDQSKSYTCMQYLYANRSDYPRLDRPKPGKINGLMTEPEDATPDPTLPLSMSIESLGS